MGSFFQYCRSRNSSIPNMFKVDDDVLARSIVETWVIKAEKGDPDCCPKCDGKVFEAEKMVTGSVSFITCLKISQKMVTFQFNLRDRGITKIVSVAWIVLVSWTAWPTMTVLTANSTAINATLESLARKFVPLMWTTKSLTLPWSNPMIRPRIVQGVEVRFSKLKPLLAKTDYITRNVPIVLLARSSWPTTPSLMVLIFILYAKLLRWWCSFFRSR